MSDEKHKLAIEVLGKKLHELGGIVFVRYMANCSEETKKTYEAYEFMGRLMEGNLNNDESDFLEPYLKPLYEISDAIKILQKEN